MKELTIKKETLDVVRQMVADGQVSQEVAEKYFPELRESESERIREALKEYFINSFQNNGVAAICGVHIIDILAWLEKQGEQEQGSEFKADDWYVSKVDGKIHNIYYSDKIEPKFHKGDWIVWKDKCYKVNYNGCGYVLVDQDGLSTSLEYGTIDENAHLWDVTTDAKDGDVLHSKKHNLIWIYKDNKHYYASINLNYADVVSFDNEIVIPSDACPANRVQRSILFQKMEESNYKWDADKKNELKKIEQKPTDNDMKEALRTEYEKGRADAIVEMQKPAWSEEDEETLGWLCTFLNDYGHEFYEGNEENVIDWLKSLKGRVQPKQEWSEEDIRNIENIDSVLFYDKDLPEDTCMRLRNWLKSLRPHNAWKPSEEQMESLFALLPTICSSNPIFSLYEDLKKLKG